MLNSGPHTTPDDALLAQYIGEQGWTATVQHQNDPLLSILDSYREEVLAESNTDTAELWARVSTGVTPAKLTFVQHSFTYWAAAAIVVLSLGFFSWLYVHQSPSLLAETHDNLAVLTLSDGSSVTLRPHSRLFIKRETDKQQVYQLQGEAYFDVAKRDGRAFSVHTKHSVVTVLGTRFNVKAWGNETRLFVEEGLVSFNTKENDKINAPAGTVATLDHASGKLLVDKASSAALQLGWKSQSMYFKNRTVASLIDEIEHHFKVNLILPEEVKQESLSGSLSLSTIHQTLKELETVLGGRFEQTQRNTIWVFRRI